MTRDYPPSLQRMVLDARRSIQARIDAAVERAKEDNAADLQMHTEFINRSVGQRIRWMKRKGDVK